MPSEQNNPFSQVIGFQLFSQEVKSLCFLEEWMGQLH